MFAAADPTKYEDLTVLRLRLKANGYFPVPVTGIHAKCKGKAGKAVLLPNWADICRFADQATIHEWSIKYSEWSNTGILCGTMPHPLLAFDIDIRDEGMAEQIQGFLVNNLGPGLVRIGLPPKRLVLYRTDNEFGKFSTARFYAPNNDDDKYQVEVLGSGNQFVAFGDHPDTREPYSWPDGSLLDVKHEDLRPVKLADANLALKQMERTLESAGLRSADRLDRDESSGLRSAGLHAKAPVSAELLTSALAVIPSDDRALWIKFGHVIKDALGADDGFEVWDAWSEKSEKYPGRQECETLWSKSLGRRGEGARTATVGSIFHCAKRMDGSAPVVAI